MAQYPTTQPTYGTGPRTAGQRARGSSLQRLGLNPMAGSPPFPTMDQALPSMQPRPTFNVVPQLAGMFTGGGRGMGMGFMVGGGPEKPTAPRGDSWRDWIRKPEVASGLAQGLASAWEGRQNRRVRERELALEERAYEDAKRRQDEEDARRRRVAELLAPLLRERLNR